MMELVNADQISAMIEHERELRCLELFDKQLYDLDMLEIMKLDDYIKDCNNPVWRQIMIDGAPTAYKISNTGNVLSFKHSTISHHILKQALTIDGYPTVKLYINGNCKMTICVHRLVAQTFIPNPENKPQVNHISGIKTCNWVGNLEWVTSKENVRHAFDNGLNHALIGELNGAAKYTNDHIDEICRLLASGKSSREISKITDTSKYVIDNIKSRKTWIHISSHYNIPDVKCYDVKPKGTRQKIIGMLQNSNITYDDIMTRLGLPNTIRNRMYISNIKCELKRKLQKVETSTTIDHL